MADLLEEMPEEVRRAMLNQMSTDSVCRIIQYVKKNTGKNVTKEEQGYLLHHIMNVSM